MSILVENVMLKYKSYVVWIKEMIVFDIHNSKRNKENVILILP